MRRLRSILTSERTSELIRKQETNSLDRCSERTNSNSEMNSTRNCSNFSNFNKRKQKCKNRNLKARKVTNHLTTLQSFRRMSLPNWKSLENSFSSRKKSVKLLNK